VFKSRSQVPFTLFIALCVIGAVLGFSGCSTYEAKPLNTDTVDKALEQKPLDSVILQASQFKHPLIHSIEIKGEGGYSPQELAVIACVLSPSLKALRDQNAVAESQVIQAGILPNPQVNFTIDRPTQEYDPVAVAAKGMSLSYDLSALLSHRDVRAAAQANARSVNLSVAWLEWQYAQAVQVSAYRILSLEERLPQARSIEQDLNEALNEAKQAVLKGYQTTGDVALLNTSLNQAQTIRFDMEQKLIEERASLNLSLGRQVTEIIPIKRSADIPSLTEAVSYSSNEIESTRLDLVALKLGYESQEYSLRAAVKSQFPKIGISLNSANDTTPISTRGAGVTFDIPLFDRNQGQVAIAKATRQQLFDEYIARCAEARSQVVQISAQISHVKTEVISAEKAGLEEHAILMAHQKTRESDNLDYQMYRDARMQLANRNLELSTLKQELFELSVALEIATGRSLLSSSITKTINP
jgi:outer membrane protein TolC